MITINNGRAGNDDIDHLGNRRVRAVGELIQNQLNAMSNPRESRAMIC